MSEPRLHLQHVMRLPQLLRNRLRRGSGSRHGKREGGRQGGRRGRGGGCGGGNPSVLSDLRTPWREHH